MGQLGFFDADWRLAALSEKGDPVEANRGHGNGCVRSPSQLFLERQREAIPKLALLRTAARITP